MAVNWTDAEVFQLISCWAEEGIQEQLEGCKHNKHIYERLSRNVAEHNIEKTGEQCRTKVKKLCQEYKKIKDKQNLTGCGRTEWKYFNKLDEILGTRLATCPPVLLETQDSQPILSDHDGDETDVEEAQEGSVQDHSSTGVTDDHDVSDNQNGSSNSTVGMSGTPPSHHGSSSSSAKEDSDEISTTGKAGIKGKKRKRSKG